MNRIYHLKVNYGHLLALTGPTVLLLAALWWQQPLVALPALMLTLVWIERLIHTTYTLTTKQTLVIDRGRFSRQRTIALSAIRQTQKDERLAWLKGGNIRLTLTDGQQIGLAVDHADDFLLQLEKRQKLSATTEEESEASMVSDKGSESLSCEE